MADLRSLTLSERLLTVPAGDNLVPKEFISRGQRERILLATAEVVAERGYAKTTIELIARTARVALSTFYEHFAGKEEALLAAFDQNVTALTTHLIAINDPEQPWPEQIAVGIDSLIRLAARFQSQVSLCLTEIQAAGPSLLARYEQMLEGFQPKLREGRDLHPNRDLLPDGLELAIVGGLIWLLQERVTSAAEAELEQLRPEMVEMTLMPYVGRDEARAVALKICTRSER